MTNSHYDKEEKLFDGKFHLFCQNFQVFSYKFSSYGAFFRVFGLFLHSRPPKGMSEPPLTSAMRGFALKMPKNTQILSFY